MCLFLLPFLAHHPLRVGIKKKVWQSWSKKKKSRTLVYWKLHHNLGQESSLLFYGMMCVFISYKHFLQAIFLFIRLSFFPDFFLFVFPLFFIFFLSSLISCFSPFFFTSFPLHICCKLFLFVFYFCAQFLLSYFLSRILSLLNFITFFLWFFIYLLFHSLFPLLTLQTHSETVSVSLPVFTHGWQVHSKVNLQSAVNEHKSWGVWITLDTGAGAFGGIPWPEVMVWWVVHEQFSGDKSSARVTYTWDEIITKHPSPHKKKV